MEDQNTKNLKRKNSDEEDNSSKRTKKDDIQTSLFNLVVVKSCLLLNLHCTLEWIVVIALLEAALRTELRVSKHKQLLHVGKFVWQTNFDGNIS